MKQKLVALMLVLWSYNNQNATSMNTPETKGIGIETIITKQLEELLLTLDVDEYSQAIIKKYTLKGDFNREVRAEIRDLCKELEIQEEWLYKLFNIESNGNPQAINKISGASGLIQIMPFTAKNLNTTVEKIRKQSISEQLPDIKKYISKIKGKREFKEFLDLYLAVFYPRAINEPHNFVLGSEISTSRAAIVAKQNKGIDSHGNKDGQLTKGEIANWVS